MNKRFIFIVFTIAFYFLSICPVRGVQKIRADTLKIKPCLVSSHAFDKYYSDKNFKYQKSVNPSAWNLWWMKLTKLLNPLFSNNISSIIIYAFFIGTFILLIIVLLGADFQAIIQRNHKITTGSVVFDEENPGTNIDELIQDAIKDGDYTKAIRLTYLKILQIFNASHLIVWQKEKTNRDYQVELIRTKYYGIFKQITMIYEYTWYGKFPVTSTEYSIYEKRINELNNLLDEK